MMLGDVLREARQAAAVLDPALCARIEATGESPGAFARAAVTSFERHASGEDWATMLSAIRTASDPGKACLEMMVRWRLQHSCTCAAENDNGSKREAT
jgi:hypothetical protein